MLDIAILNLILATTLVIITSYTDIFDDNTIYNIHLAPFLMAGILIATMTNPMLFLSALLVFGVYCIFYFCTKFTAKLAMLMGIVPLPPEEKPLKGGDLKLAVILALFLGHLPVLYGTALGAFAIIVFYGIKFSIKRRTVVAVVDMAMGRIHAVVPFAPFLGASTIFMYIGFNWLGC